MLPSAGSRLRTLRRRHTLDLSASKNDKESRLRCHRLSAVRRGARRLGTALGGCHEQSISVYAFRRSGLSVCGSLCRPVHLKSHDRAGGSASDRAPAPVLAGDFSSGAGAGNGPVNPPVAPAGMGGSIDSHADALEQPLADCSVPSRDRAPRRYHIDACPWWPSSPILQNLVFGTHSGCQRARAAARGGEARSWSRATSRCARADARMSATPSLNCGKPSPAPSIRRPR
jgi:hypothetical protein